MSRFDEFDPDFDFFDEFPSEDPFIDAPRDTDDEDYEELRKAEDEALAAGYRNSELAWQDTVVERLLGDIEEYLSFGTLAQLRELIRINFEGEK